MKKILSLLLITVMLLSMLVGCSSETNTDEVKENTSSETTTSEKSEENEESKEKDSVPRDELTFATFRDMRDFNPHLYAGEMWMQEMVYETLVSVESSGIEPCLAESWEITNDGKTYTFKIREGVKFTDGAVCDAYAIKANFDALCRIIRGQG